jgi:hypothetical protein
LTTVEGMLFEALKDNLPDGWVVSLEAGAGTGWVVVVHRSDASKGAPRFTVCRWHNCVGLFVRWMDDSASSIVFTELSPVIDLIPSSIFAVAEASLATVRTASWAETRH